jgi:hypothetical protein
VSDDDGWERGTFAGTEGARLTPDERLVLLEGLLEIAEASGALQRARDDKQREIDALWAR